MNIRSYCRGIGAGIIVAALIMGASKTTRAMSEAEIKDAAKKLGMVESSTLIEIEKNKDDATNKDIDLAVTEENETVESSVDKYAGDDKGISGDNNSADDKKTSEDKNSDGDSSAGSTSDIGSKDKNESDSVTSDKSEEIEATSVSPIQIDPLDGEAGFTSKDEYVEVKIIKGDSSVSVARRMFEAGLVESAVEFDRYLCSNGYDKSISVGVYEIGYGLDFDEMAKIITRRK